ncbi:MAG: aldose 1-epimerase [Stellaceae bacterium]
MTVVASGVVTLSSGPARCEIAPGAGGAVAGFWWESGGRRIDWLRPASPGAVARADAGEMGSFPMVPYGSRIRDARFQFCGREIVETPAGAEMRHAMHGHGWRRDWTVVERGDDRLVLEYDHPAAAWPWPYRARQSFVLSPQALEITLDLENRSDGLMPAGLGFHPFFPRTPEATITARTSGVWLTDAEVMPTECTAVPPGWNLSDGRRVAELALDNVFTGWTGEAVVTWPERAARLWLSATQPLLSFLVVYTPRERDFFCVEPASHVTDAINLAREGVAGTGLRVLAPHVRRVARMSLRPELF